MMGGVSPETCWAIKKQWNNKFYYTVASCWFLLWDFWQPLGKALIFQIFTPLDNLLGRHSYFRSLHLSSSRKIKKRAKLSIISRSLGTGINVSKAWGSKNDVRYSICCGNEHSPSRCKPTFCCTLILQLQTNREIPHSQKITRFCSQMGMLHIRHLRADIFSCKTVKQAIMKLEFASKWNVVHNTIVAGVTFDTLFGPCMFQWDSPVLN